MEGEEELIDGFPAKDINNVLDFVRWGIDLYDACKRCNLSVTRFFTIADNHPDIAARLEEAQKMCTRVWEEKIIHLCISCEPNKDEIAKTKMIVENMRWLMQQRDNERYGANKEKQELPQVMPQINLNFTPATAK